MDNLFLLFVHLYYLYLNQKTHKSIYMLIWLNKKILFSVSKTGFPKWTMTDTLGATSKGAREGAWGNSSKVTLDILNLLVKRKNKRSKVCSLVVFQLVSFLNYSKAGHLKSIENSALAFINNNPSQKDNFALWLTYFVTFNIQTINSITATYCNLLFVDL